MVDLKPVEWRNNKLIILDQTRLPGEEVYLEITDYKEAAEAIKRLAVRGAPAIGVAAAYAVALGALSIKTKVKAEFMAKLQQITQTLRESRPTARNLFWAVEYMEETARRGKILRISKQRWSRKPLKFTAARWSRISISV